MSVQSLTFLAELKRLPANAFMMRGQRWVCNPIQIIRRLDGPFSIVTSRCINPLTRCDFPAQAQFMIPGTFTRRSFLKTASAFAAIAPFLRSGLEAAEGRRPLIAYVGTFSSPLHNVLPTQVDLPPGNGHGIHIFQVNRATGALTPIGEFELPSSPNCLVIDASGTHLYSTNETDRVGENKAGSISAFAIDRQTGRLTHLNTESSGSPGPTYLSLHPSGKFLLVANYFGGSVAVLPILPDGKLGPLTDLQKDSGTLGPKQAVHAPPGSFAFSGHDVPHSHMVKADTSGRFVISTDLALDQILVWKFDAHTGKLTPNNPASVSLPAGDGPRHFDFHPNGRYFYSLQEEGSTIVLYDYDAAQGRLRERQTISSLPPGYAGSNFTSEILVSADGKYLYVGNRLHDGISIFSIARNGTLKYVTEEWTHGDYPRSFNFDPTGNFLYACNQRADNIAVFRVNKASGKLAFTGYYAAVGNPSVITFLDLAKSN